MNLRKYILFKSSFRDGLSDDEKLNLFKNINKSNLEKGVSGRLIYSDNLILEYIEGDLILIDMLMIKILKDQRHKNVVILSEGELEECNFSDWLIFSPFMHETDFEEVRYLNNHVSNIDKVNILTAKNRHISVEILKSFYKNGELNYQAFWTGN